MDVLEVNKIYKGQADVLEVNVKDKNIHIFYSYNYRMEYNNYNDPRIRRAVLKKRRNDFEARTRDVNVKFDQITPNTGNKLNIAFAVLVLSLALLLIVFMFYKSADLFRKILTYVFSLTSFLSASYLLYRTNYYQNRFRDCHRNMMNNLQPEYYSSY